jgi:hypothetical protein
VSIRANVGRSGEHNAVQRPEKPNIIREALALVDAAYQPVVACTFSFAKGVVWSTIWPLACMPTALIEARVCLHQEREDCANCVSQ